MTVDRAKLALAARRTRILAEQLSDVGRDVLIDQWSELLETIDTAGPGTGELALVEYRRSIEERLSVKQLHTPLIEQVGR